MIDFKKENPTFEQMMNKVIWGDCFEVLKKIPDKSVDLVLTDPPYGVGMEYDKFDDNKQNLKKLIDAFMPEVLRI